MKIKEITRAFAAAAMSAYMALTTTNLFAQNTTSEAQNQQQTSQKSDTSNTPPQATDQEATAAVTDAKPILVLFFEQKKDPNDPTFQKNTAILQHLKAFQDQWPEGIIASYTTEQLSRASDEHPANKIQKENVQEFPAIVLLDKNRKPIKTIQGIALTNLANKTPKDGIANWIPKTQSMQENITISNSKQPTTLPKDTIESQVNPPKEAPKNIATSDSKQPPTLPEAPIESQVNPPKETPKNTAASDTKPPSTSPKDDIKTPLTPAQQAQKNMAIFDSKETPILIDFYADWCPPCQAMMPQVEKLSKDWKDGHVIKVNIDNIDLYKGHSIGQLKTQFAPKIPTFLTLHPDRKVQSVQGGIIPDLNAHIRALLPEESSGLLPNAPQTMTVPALLPQ